MFAAPQITSPYDIEALARRVERRLDLNDERRRKQLRHQGRKAKRIAKDGAR